METYRIHDDASVYFVTYSVVSWLPVFVSERACKLLTDSLAFCHTQKGLRVNAYVIMPTHMHAIVFDRDYDPARLRQTLCSFLSLQSGSDVPSLYRVFDHSPSDYRRPRPGDHATTRKNSRVQVETRIS